MTPALEREIMGRCPPLFALGSDRADKEVFRCFDGWKQILADLVGQLAGLVERMPSDLSPLTGYTKEIEEAIGLAKECSLVTCEVCGATGRLIGERWVAVRCEQHESDGVVA